PETPASPSAPPAESGVTAAPSGRHILPALPSQPVPIVPSAPQPHDLSRIAQDLQIRKAQVEAVVQLLDEENTVPFITRYRKERTGGLNEDAIRRIQDRVAHLRELANRKPTILKSIANQGRLTDVRGPLRNFTWDTGSIVAARIETLPEGKGKEYEPYFNFRELVKEIPPHRVLAINRGEKGNVLRVRIDTDVAMANEIAQYHMNL